LSPNVLGFIKIPICYRYFYFRGYFDAHLLGKKMAIDLFLLGIERRMVNKIKALRFPPGYGVVINFV